MKMKKGNVIGSGKENTNHFITNTSTTDITTFTRYDSDNTSIIDDSDQDD
jgi:hypothetical protein